MSPPYSRTSTAAAMPMSILPAMEKLSSQAMFFFSARYTNSAITADYTATTISGVQSPVQVNSPSPDTNAPM